MSSPTSLEQALNEVLRLIASLDPANPSAQARLDATFPLDGAPLRRIRTLLREGIAERRLADREAGGVRFSRLRKAPDEGELSVDVVHMSAPGPGHTHPRGEFDLCFAVDGDPRFDGRPEGWTVYPPGSWHVPTVTGGTMDILYFLPGGAIRFEPEPAEPAS